MSVASAIVRVGIVMAMLGQGFETRHTVAVMMVGHNYREQHDEACHQHDVTDCLFFVSHNLRGKGRTFLFQHKDNFWCARPAITPCADECICVLMVRR